MATSKKIVNKEQMEKQNEVVEIVKLTQQQIMAKKKEDLPKYIKKRKKQLTAELAKYATLAFERKSPDEPDVEVHHKCFPLLDIGEFCFSPFIKGAGIAPQYSASELDVILDYFKQCIKEMNEYELFPPTKEQFCNLCGMSTEMFTQYKNGSSPEIREVLLRVEDYIANYLNISGLTRKTDTVTGIFIQKSSLGRKEATEPTVQINNNNLVLSDQEFAELMAKYPKK